MRIVQLLIFSVLLCIADVVFSQSDMDWMGPHYAEILKTMKLTYKKPVGFSEVMGVECFKNNPKLERIITCAGHQLHSNDEQFIAFIPIYKIFDKKDSIDMQKLMPSRSFDVIDKLHTSQIRNKIRHSLGKESERNWKKYVKYYSAEEARHKFNADSAIFFTIKLDSADYFKGKYNHLEALYLQKKGRGFVNFYCFYTDKAKKDLPAYWKAIEGIFRYDD